ncbi:hypothetical protein ANN_18289 [Periplaneta americana]|uniref:Uncharacterized protein n=1 Tax=Periplaneta americana TaxID=6978 RepID=A0ABQ8SNC0_PERAM|nr:hypothetical protein ANN_18289 [Periplaneta americana]
MGLTERGADAAKRWFRSEAADFYDTKIDPMMQREKRTRHSRLRPDIAKPVEGYWKLSARKRFKSADDFKRHSFATTDSWRDLILPKSQNTGQIQSLVCLRITDADSGDEDCKNSNRAQLQAAAELVTEIPDIVQPYNEEGGTDIRKDSDLISNEIENSPPPTRRIKRERNKAPDRILLIRCMSTHICLTWSQTTKGNIEGEEFDPVLWIEFGVAQWSERLRNSAGRIRSAALRWNSVRRGVGSYGAERGGKENTHFLIHAREMNIVHRILFFHPQAPLELMMSLHLFHACLSLAVVVHCDPVSLRNTSDHLLLGRLQLLFPMRGSHMVEAYIHLLQSILLTCPPHFHLRRCASLTATGVSLAAIYFNVQCKGGVISLWGIIKQDVSKHRYQTIEDLKQAVREAFRETSPPLLRKISHRKWRRIILCRDNDGAHIDVMDH